MRILWSSNAPWVPSGYGQQTKYTIPALKSLGHDVGLLAWCGLVGARINLDDTPVYPRGGNPYGVDVLGADAQDYKADIAITLIDAWVYNPDSFPGIRWVPYFPVDSEPIAPGIANAVRRAYDRIVYSKFAAAQCDEIGLSYHYVPHMIDTDLFAPRDPSKWRGMMNLSDDTFIVGMVAANKGYPSRKSIPQALEAFVRFHKRHPNSKLYMHTLPFEPGEGGSIDIPSMMAFFGDKYKVNLNEVVMWIHAYQMRLGVPAEYMADMYNGIDVLMSPSMGEGFGIPIVEAQACGTPVIVGDWTSMSELLFAGWKVKRSEAAPFWISGYNTYQFLPKIEAIDDRLEKAYKWWSTQRGEGDDVPVRARKGALQYSTKRVTEKYWKPTLEAIGNRIRSGQGELQLVKF